MQGRSSELFKQRINAREGWWFAVIAGVAYLATAWFNETVVDTTTSLKAVDWVYLPAGVKIISILIARQYGAIGVGLANYVVALTQWQGSNPAVVAMVSLVWVGSTYLGIALMLKLCRVKNNLSGLRYGQLTFIILGTNLTGGLIYNAFLWAIGEREYFEYWSSVIAMTLGDFLGTGILLMLMLLLVELKARIKP